MSEFRVLIDLERLRSPNSGLGQVALNLGKEFLAHPSDIWQPVYLLPENRTNVFSVPVAHEVPSWRRRYAPRFAPRYALWHMLHQDAKYLPAPGSPYVLTINDLNFLEEKSPQKAAKRLAHVQKLVDRAVAITVISEFTGGVVREHLEIGDTPIHVIHIGPCTDTSQPGSRPGSLPDGEYLFSLGVVRPKKNFHVLVEFLERVADVNLVIAGNIKGDYAQEIRERAASLGLGERLVLAGEVSEAEKVWLFRNCKAFVFPSLYEGFGLPLLESMSFGKPTFSSSRTSLPEVGGDHVFYWDNFTPDHMVDVYDRGMRAYAEDPGLRDNLIARAQTFTWETAAAKYSALYEQILSAG